jgi:hypothetical protein
VAGSSGSLASLQALLRHESGDFTFTFVTIGSLMFGSMAGESGLAGGDGGTISGATPGISETPEFGLSIGAVGEGGVLSLPELCGAAGAAPLFEYG